MRKRGLASRSTLGIWVAVLLVACGVRGWLWLTYRPVAFSDTHSYRRLANATYNPKWDGYDGTRTPGYPLIMALFHSKRHIFLAQLAMGLGITLLLFYIGWQISGKIWFGGALALAHSLNLGQLLFEANLLTETPTTFWIMLSLAGLAFWLYHPKRRSIVLAYALGLTTTAAALTRPLFIYLPLWVLLYLVVDGRRLRINFHRKARILCVPTIKTTLAFLLPVAVLFGVWINFIHSHFHDWSLTTMVGYQMVQHTGSYFEYVPDKYAALRDTYIKYRNLQIAQHGTQTNAIWDAIPEMTKVSGMTFFDLNRLLVRISTRLILDHPDLYLRDCVEGWWLFWRSPVYWSQGAFSSPGMGAVINVAIRIERPLLWAANILFILLSLLSAGLAIWPPRKLPAHGPVARLRSIATGLPAFIWCVAGSIWVASILQTLLDHGDNPRFLVPLQSLVVLWVLWYGWQLLSPPANTLVE